MVDLNTEAPIDEILTLDERRRTLLAEVEALRAERNRVSKEIPTIRDKDQKQERITAMRQVGDRISALEGELQPVQARLDQALLEVPNLPDPSVPVGPDESQNVVVRQEGALPTFDFAPRPHWELGEALGIIDFERGVKISGTRFYLLKGAGARLQRAVIAWMLDVPPQYHGYTEIYPPYMVRADCLVGTGNLPKFSENLYHDVEDDLWMIPTAEVPVTNMYREEILAEEQLPIYHVAYTACFRREKMSAGKDTRGIKRGHQFDKVEMVKFVKPETSMDELAKLVDNAEDIARRLGLPYRVVQMCTGDLSLRRLSSTTWSCGRRAVRNGWKYRRAAISRTFRPGALTSAIARPTVGGWSSCIPSTGRGWRCRRLIIAIIENYQQADGSIVVPEPLRPYMGGLDVIR
jgi:seryl-tRNA synthetase